MGEKGTQAEGNLKATGFFLLAWSAWLVAMAAFAPLIVGMGAGTAKLYLLSAAMELLLAVPVIVFILIRKIRLSELFGRAAPRQIALGAAAGALLVLLSMAVAALWNLLVLVTGGSIKPNDVPVPVTLWQFLAAFSAVGLAAPVVEEPVMRGLLLNAGSGVLRRNSVLLLVTVVFAMAHGRFLGLPSFLLGGLLLGALAWRSGSLWPGIAAHLAFNTAAIALQTVVHNAGRASGLAAASASPNALALLSAGIALALVSLPFLLALGGVLMAFWRVTPQAPRPEPTLIRLRLPQCWPWVAACILLLCYLALDVLRVYGIIGVR